MSLRLIAHDTSLTTGTSKTIDVTGHAAGERLFLVVYHTGGTLTDVSGAGTVFADWTVHIDGAPVNRPLDSTDYRLSILSIARETALSGTVTLTQGASGRLTATALAGFYNVSNSQSISGATVSGSPLPLGSFTFDLALPNAPAASVIHDSTYLVASVFAPLYSANSAVNPRGFSATYLHGGSPSSTMLSVAMATDRAPGIPFGAGRSLRYTGVTTAADTHFCAVTGVLGIVSSVAPAVSYTDVFTPKVQAYSGIHPAVMGDLGETVFKAQGYIVNQRDNGLFVGKAQAYVFSPADPLDQQYSLKAVTYAVVGLLPGNLMYATKVAAYAVTGMHIERLPQELGKAVVYAVALYDDSGRLFQPDDRQLGPVPPKFDSSQEYPRVIVNDGGFSVYPITDGDHTLYILTDGDELLVIPLSLARYTRADIAFSGAFNQIALVAAPSTAILENSVRARMLLRKIPSADVQFTL